MSTVDVRPPITEPDVVASARHRPPRTRAARVLPALLVILVGACLLNLGLGSLAISPGSVLRSLVGQGTSRDHLVLFDLRAPRIVIGILIGVGLAMSGTIMQGITQNDLADPGILGINACAGLAIFIYLAFGGGIEGGSLNGDPLPFMLWAFVGGIGGAALIYALAYRGGAVTPSRLLLVGVAVGLGATAAIPILARRIPSTSIYQFAASFIEGSLSGASWRYALTLLPWILILGPIAYYRSQLLNVMTLGDDVATNLGIAVQRHRLGLVVVAVALAASCVAIGGGIAFVGLVAPHLGRRLVGPNHRVLFPAAALIGAILLVLADIVSRNLLDDFTIPVGIVVAVIGAPYFLFLLARTRG